MCLLLKGRPYQRGSPAGFIYSLAESEMWLFMVQKSVSTKVLHWPFLPFCQPRGMCVTMVVHQPRSVLGFGGKCSASVTALDFETLSSEALAIFITIHGPIHLYNA